MSWLCDSSELLSGAWLSSRYAGHGVLGANVPSTGTDGPSALYGCLSLPADNGVEVRGLMTRWPVNGTLDIGEDGEFTYTGTSDYFEFRSYADGVASSSDIGYGPGISRITLSSGGASFSGSFTLDDVVAIGDFSAAAGASFSGSITLGASTMSGTFAPEGADAFPAITHPRRLVITPDPRLQGTNLPGSGGPLPQPYSLCPGSNLDIEWDWRLWLGADQLATYAVTWRGAPVGEASNEAQAQGVVRVWVAVPDDATENTRGALLCEITTTAGRTDSRIYELLVKQL